MNRIKLTAIICAALLLTGCGGEKEIDNPPKLIVTTAATTTKPEKTEQAKPQTEEPSAEPDVQETAEASPATAEATQEAPAETEPEATTAPAAEPDPPAADSITGSYDKEFFANDLFIGDSISTGLYLYYKLEPENVAASVGNTPYKAYTTAIDMFDGSSVTPVEYAEKRQPKRIFIMLGSNGMASSWDIESQESSYRTLIEKLQGVCPNSDIGVISIPPVTADTSYTTIKNPDVVSFNEYLRTMCADMGIRYFDLHSLLTDGSGCFSKAYAEADGMHFKGTTYDVMLTFLQNELS